MLERENIPFRCIVSDADENAHGDVREVVRTLAGRKAHAVADGLRSCLVLGADTLVELDGEALGKPIDEADARDMLTRLSGNCHNVHTGVCLIDADTGKEEYGVCTSRVFFRILSQKDIDEYIDSGEYIGKAGSYAIQMSGGRFVERYEGDYDNIVGLPVAMVKEMLLRFDAAI